MSRAERLTIEIGTYNDILSMMKRYHDIDDLESRLEQERELKRAEVRRLLREQSREPAQ